MSKYLELEVLKEENEVITFKVKRQSHILKEFGDDSSFFYSSEGLRLESVDYPQIPNKVSHSLGTLFVRGNVPDEDDRILSLRKGDAWSMIQRGVGEYNAYFGGGHVNSPMFLNMGFDDVGVLDDKIISDFCICCDNPKAEGSMRCEVCTGVYI